MVKRLRLAEANKEVEFDYGHRIPNHASKCFSVHGHRGRVRVTVRGPIIPEGDGNSSEGMVQDFSDIKKALVEHVHDVFDHTFVMFWNDPVKAMLARPWTQKSQNNNGQRYFVSDFGWVQEVRGVPTAENLACWCFEALSKALNQPERGIEVTSVKFWETPTSMAEYRGLVEEV